jgi:hypothetical protein
MGALLSATEGSVEVARLTAGICIAITSVFLPGVGLLGPLAEFAINKFVKRPEKLLIDELKKGNLEILDMENAAAFIPMAYKFFEAAKEGEYEHNLKLLAEILVNKLRAKILDVPSFARMSRRVEGLTMRDLRVIALIDTVLEAESGTLTSADGDPAPYLISSLSLAGSQLNRAGFDMPNIQESLADLSARGFLIAEGASRWDKGEEYYYPSSSFRELIENAKNSLVDSISECPEQGPSTAT